MIATAAETETDFFPVPLSAYGRISFLYSRLIKTNALAILRSSCRSCSNSKSGFVGSISWVALSNTVKTDAVAEKSLNPARLFLKCTDLLLMQNRRNYFFGSITELLFDLFFVFSIYLILMA
jgi:hypothetical protein